MSAAASSMIEELGPWFHNLHLPGGVQTAPDHFLGDFPSYKWKQIKTHIPQDLTGWNVLDIGCNAGYYAFKLAARGASVTGIDIDERYLAQARWAATQFELPRAPQFKKAQVYDLVSEPQKYDMVLFMGVFYHLRYPLLALDIISRKVSRCLIFQTLTMAGEDVLPQTDNKNFQEREILSHPGWPKMAFIEHRFAGDPTNWWAPNHAAVEAMIRSSGLWVAARPGHEIYLCRPNPHHTSPTADLDKKEYGSATGLLYRQNKIR